MTDQLEEERRSQERRTTLRKGSIVSEDGASLADCVVKNISDEGAKLKHDPEATVPPRFTLKLPNGNLRPCEVTWTGDGAVGVRFLDATV